MKASSIFSWGWLPLIALLLTACATQNPQNRIAANPELFESFPEDVQESIREGRVEPGFTADMVRMAVGEPDRIVTRRGDDGDETIYVYTRLSPGLSFGLGGSTGGRGSSVGTGVGVSTGGRESDVLRVVFEEGRVSAVEEID